MSNYSSALTVVGYAVGTYFGYPQLGAVVGGVVGGVADYQNLPDNEGPRLGDAQTISASYGDVIPWMSGAARVGGQVWWVSERREIGTTTEQGKGGGPKNTTYTYEQDVLFGLTSHEVGDVARIWLNGKLIWTQMPDADIDSIIASQESPLWSRLTIYTGGASQLPDPTYEAAVGSGNAPAYRGRCSVFIEGLQLGTSGQMPNLTFEVIKQGLATLFFHAPMTTDGNDIISPAATLTTEGAPSYSVDGGLFERSPGNYEHVTLTTTAPGKISIQEVANRGVWSLQCGIEVVPEITAVSGDLIRFFGSYTFLRQFMFAYRNDGGPAQLYVYVVDGATTLTSLGAAVSSGEYRIVFDTTGDSSTWSTKFYVNDVLKHTHISTGLDIENVLVGIANGDGRGVSSMRFSAVKILASGVGTLEPGEPLQDVVEQLCDRAGMPAGTYDATALSTITKPVRSLLLAQLGAARAALQPLQLAYHFDCTLTDKLYFRPRATSAVATIPLDDLAAGVDKPSGEPFALTQGSDIELPAQVAVRYRNVENDYQTGVEVSDRLLSGQVAMQSIEVALGMTPSEAKALADVMVNDNLAALTRGTVSLSMAYAHLQPADVVIIDGETMRLGRKQDARGVITFEARRHDASTILSAGVTDDTGYTNVGTVTAPSATELLVLDIPLLRDAEDGPGHYVAANGGSKWAGCSVQRSINNVDFTQATTVLERAVFGTCTTTLADFTGIGFDEVNSVAVSVGTGELASSTRDAMLLDSSINTILVGSEVIRFVTATLTGTAPNRYTLTRLLRGQRGTEWAMAGHVATELCTLLRQQGLRYVRTLQADIGAVRYIKGVSSGLNAAGVTSESYTNMGVSQKPFSPTNLRSEDMGNGQYRITWQRRSRISLQFSDGAPVFLPLGESSEVYSVDMFDASNAFVDDYTSSGNQLLIGGSEITNTYEEGLLKIQKISTDIYGVTFFDSIFTKLNSSGQTVASVTTGTGMIFGGIHVAVAYSATNAYAIATDRSQSGDAGQKKLYRYELSTMTLAATLDILSLDGNASGGLYFIVGSLWSVSRNDMAVRKHHATTLAVTATHNLGAGISNRNPLTAVVGDVIFIHGKDWDYLQAFDTVTETLLWSVQINANITGIYGSTTALLAYDELGGKIFGIDLSDGSVTAEMSIILDGSTAVVVGSDLYAQEYSRPNGGYLRGDIVAVDMDALSIVDRITPPARYIRLSGDIDSNPVVICSSTGPIQGYVMHEFGPGPSLAGYKVVVRQISSSVGRGYPAEITL